MRDRRNALETLNLAIQDCEKCRLHLTRTHALCGEGNLRARLMLVAQAPGDTEDREGRMFIGPSGQVLDALLDETEVSRNEIYMTNLIKCRLPGYRKPKQDEIEACSRFLEQEIALIAPEVIAPLGYYATRYIFERYNISLSKTKAEFPNFFGRLFLARNQKVFPLPHPAALLYNRSFKPATLEKYRKLKVLSRECTYSLKPSCENGQLDRDWVEIDFEGG